MKILAWNSRGLGQTPTRLHLRNLVRLNRPSLVLVSETLTNDTNSKKWIHKMGLPNFWWSPAVEKKEGYWVLWNNDVDISFEKVLSWCIHMNVRVKSGENFEMTFVHASSILQVQEKQWQSLKNFASNSYLPWCSIGDFNVVLYKHEKRGGSDPKEDSKRLAEGGQRCIGSVKEEITIRWKRPMTGWTTLNVDGAARGAPGQAAIGAILRNEDGRSVGALAQKIGVSNALVAEAQALVEGLRMALACRISKLQIESDSYTVGSAFLNKIESPWRIGSLIQEAQHLCNFFISVKFLKVYREANVVADQLAKFALDSYSCFWVSNPPEPVTSAILDDFYGKTTVRSVVTNL